MTIQSKLPHVGTTIFSRMTSLANAHQAINLSQGFPDFDVDPELIRLVEKYMARGYNQYAPSHGVLPLRERLVAKQQNMYGAVYDPETEITITSGATEAIFAAITAIVNRDDEVIILDIGLNWIGFSVDAADKATYEKIQRGSDFDIVCRNIRYLTRQRVGKGFKCPVAGKNLPLPL